MKRERLEGRKFGKLIVEEYIGGRKYRCLCECGKRCEVLSQNLKSSHTTSCGCKKVVDLTGQNFGSLLVKQRSFDKIRGGYRRSAWTCECLRCGRIVDIYQDSLISGETTSCGCLAKEKEMPQKIKDTFVDGTQMAKLMMQPTKSNKSGVVGVNWDKSRNKWQASIRFKGKKYNLGRFDDFELAVKVRKKAEQELHGEFLKAREKKTE